MRAFEKANPRTRELTRYLIATYPAVDGYRDAIRLGYQQGEPDPTVLYPLAFWPLVTRYARQRGLDPLRVLALMRQESLFDPAARSPADARGLMQLLPSTARRVARRLGRAEPGDLYDPDVNVDLGTAHLDELLREHAGDWIPTLAAYNGGEAALAKWERRFGDLPPDEFVESITYRETKDYVKRVLGHYRRYRTIYGAPPLGDAEVQSSDGAARPPAHRSRRARSPGRPGRPTTPPAWETPGSVRKRPRRRSWCCF
jgi:soluble lytic murein transglycosylase